MTQGRRAILVACSITAVAMAACHQSASTPSGEAVDRGAENPSRRVVTDMRGVAISVPTALSRVATIDDGFVEAVMTRLGTIRTLVAVGSSSQQRTWSYSYPTSGGRSYAVADGMGTMRALHPWMADLPCASLTSGEAINYETIAAARPQVVVIRVGDCTIGTSTEVVARTTGLFEEMGLPIVVLRSPTDFRGQGLRHVAQGDRSAGAALRDRSTRPLR